MSRARWLGLPAARLPHAQPRRAWQRGVWLERLFSAVLAVGLVAATVLWLGPRVLAALAHEARQARTVDVAHDCRAPVDTEQLHVVLVSRDGRVTFDGCLYVGSRGTYRRTRSGLPEPRP